MATTQNKPIKKVGQRHTVTFVTLWRECENCGKPAQFKVSYLLSGTRSNPHSKAYRKDDCSWCSDMDTFACKKHVYDFEHSPNEGYVYCSTFPLARFKHMGFYEHKINQSA
jgi:hypothetical protein